MKVRLLYLEELVHIAGQLVNGGPWRKCSQHEYDGGGKDPSDSNTAVGGVGVGVVYCVQIHYIGGFLGGQ